LFVVVDSEERRLLEDIHLECSEKVEVDGVPSLHRHTSYMHFLEEVWAEGQQLHIRHLVVLQKCSSFAEEAAVELFYLFHHIRTAWHQHGWILVEEFLEMEPASACCLAVFLEEMGLFVDLVGRKSKLLLVGAWSGVASRAVVVAGMIAGAIAADIEGMIELVVFETELAVVPP
jgi:hypothetical protein